MSTGTAGTRGGVTSTFTYNEILHKREDLNTVKGVETIQYESILILIILHPLRPRNPSNSSWRGGEGDILIPG